MTFRSCILQADELFREQVQAIDIDPKIEANALAACFDSAEVSNICTAISETRWQNCKDFWRSLLSAKNEDLGAKIKTVVEDLDAPHLRPTSILQRIQGGVKPACYGLFSLIDHLKDVEAKPPNPSA